MNIIKIVPLFSNTACEKWVETELSLICIIAYDRNIFYSSLNNLFKKFNFKLLTYPHYQPCFPDKIPTLHPNSTVIVAQFSVALIIRSKKSPNIENKRKQTSMQPHFTANVFIFDESCSIFFAIKEK